MSQTGQAPKTAEHGSFLQPTSVSGSRVDFIQTVVVSTSIAIPLAYNTDLTLGFGLVLYDPTIPLLQRTSQNIISPDNCIAFYYPDFFVDTDNDFNYEMGTGASLTSGQKKVYTFGQWDEKTPATGLSQRRLYQLFNNDSGGSHTLYVRLKIKYILTI